jgi:hypothetical protein
MRTKNTSAADQTPLSIVHTTTTKNIEREIDGYVKSIRALITKLTPTERQKYYNGLLAFILNEQVEMSNESNKKNIDESDFTRLTVRELNLLEELSLRMQQLYRTMGHDVE